MLSVEVILVMLLAVHVLLAALSLRVAERKQKWTGSKLYYAKFFAVVVPLLGPTLIFVALASKPSRDPNLRHSTDVLHERHNFSASDVTD